MKKELNPIQNIFADIKKILKFMYLKNLDEARRYEFPEYARDSEMWLNAQTENDTFLTYKLFWTISMFQQVQPNVKVTDVNKWMEKPFSVPSKFKEVLQTEGRKRFLNSYEEKNNYYRCLNGLPNYTDDDLDFIYLSKDAANKLGVDRNIPIHLQPESIQNKFLNMSEYYELIETYGTSKPYLKFIGIYKIDPFVARTAKDFEIIRYPIDHYDINPNILLKFKEIYDNYREYVMSVLYNSRLEGHISNYRNFMGLMILLYTLLQLASNCIEELVSKDFLDDTTLYIIFSLYGIPDNIGITNTVRRKLVKNILRLIQNKGTDDVLYQLIEILGYKDTDINQLYLMKGQKFDSLSNNASSSESEPYFLELSLKETDPYRAILNNKYNTYSYHDIIDQDPEWIDDQKVQEIIHNRNYSISNSKYLTLTSSIEQFDYLFESIYLLRFILDSKDLTSAEYIQIPELFGNEEFSLYDIALCIIASYCKNNKLSGLIDVGNTPIPIAGFNFDLNTDLLDEYLNSCKYVEVSKVRAFIKNINLLKLTDINRIYNDILIPMRDWLKYKISNSTNHKEFIEYENIYKAIYTYDIDKTKVFDDYKKPIEIIRIKNKLTDDEINQLKHFYPHMISGETATNENIYQSSFRTPFLSDNKQITWRIHITIETEHGTEDRGYLYFYDILNSDNSIEYTDQSNLRPLMDYIDDEWVLNEKAFIKAIELINNLNDNELQSAYFQVKVPILNSNGKYYKKNDLLAEPIRRSGLFKNILITKLSLDAIGMSSPPSTYLEYLLTRNRTLYNFVQSETFTTNHDLWIENLTKIVLALESNLDLYLKYFEQSIIGSKLFFKPLITLINHFKSTFVKLIQSNFTYLINDKVDSGGNSNLLNLFENIQVIRFFVILSKKGYNSQFGLYDAEKVLKYKAILNDYPFYLDNKRIKSGSIRMTDELKFYKNNEEIDPKINPSAWFIGESGLGRWSNEDDFIMKTRTSNIRVKNLYNLDLTKWKAYVESYIKD